MSNSTENIASRFIGEKSVVETSGKVLNALNIDGKLDVEVTGSARAVVIITQDGHSESDKLTPKEIKDTAEALANGLQDPNIQSTTLYPEAIQAIPVLADEYQRLKNNIQQISDQQPTPNEIKIDENTTLIIPESNTGQVTVSRRGFLGIATQATVGVLITSGFEYVCIRSIIDASVNNDLFEQETKESRQKFDAVYPEKPTQFTSPDEIRQTLEYKGQRDKAWKEISTEIDRKYRNRDISVGIVGSIITMAGLFITAYCKLLIYKSTH